MYSRHDVTRIHVTTCYAGIHGDYITTKHEFAKMELRQTIGVTKSFSQPLSIGIRAQFVSSGIEQRVYRTTNGLKYEHNLPPFHSISRLT